MKRQWYTNVALVTVSVAAVSGCVRMTPTASIPPPADLPPMVNGIVLTPRVAPRPADAKTQTAVFNDAPLKLFLHEFVDTTGITVELPSGVDAAVTLHIPEEVTLSELRDRMIAALKSSGIDLVPVATNVLRAARVLKEKN